MHRQSITIASAVSTTTQNIARKACACVAVIWLSCGLCNTALAHDELASIAAYIEAYEDMAAFDGIVLIAEGEQIVWQQAFGFADYERSAPMTTESRLPLAGLSRHVTKVAIGRLIDTGKLTLQSRLADFLPDFPNARRVTIRHLLEHSAGIVHTDNMAWMNTRVPLSLDEIIARLATEKLRFTPGIDSEVSNGGYALLAKTIQVASGQAYGEYVDSAFANSGYPSVGSAQSMTAAYAPGPVYGERILMENDTVENNISTGSLHANAEDLFRFFRDSFAGKLLTAETTAMLFEEPDERELVLTSKTSKTLASISIGPATDVTVVVLSANFASPPDLSQDILSLYRGEKIALQAFVLADDALPSDELQSYSGEFRTKRFEKNIRIEVSRDHLVFAQGTLRTAFAPTTTGEFHLPLYDWLCSFSAYNTEFVCRQRHPERGTRILFERQ